MSRPVIGICTALERARWSVWDEQAMLLPRSYVTAVQRAGGLAVMLPPDAASAGNGAGAADLAGGESAAGAEDPNQLLELIDGLMLAGGADIDPASYGQPAHAKTSETVPERDAFEIALVRAAIERDMPVLGICRGMQLINVALGGTLLQHLPERFGHHEHRRVVGSFDGADHDVQLRAGTLAMRVIGDAQHATKSHHHQGIDRLGEGLEVSGVSAMDGLPEAIELAGARFVLGVQWHPEADESSVVVGALVAAAEEAVAEGAAAGGAAGEGASAEAAAEEAGAEAPARGVPG